MNDPCDIATQAHAIAVQARQRAEEAHEKATEISTFTGNVLQVTTEVEVLTEAVKNQVCAEEEHAANLPLAQRDPNTGKPKDSA